MEYSINGRRKLSEFTRKPWFKTAMGLKATVMAPFPFPVVMKAAEKIWRKKHPEGEPVSGIPNIDVKSVLIGVGLGIAFGGSIRQAFSSRKRRR